MGSLRVKAFGGMNPRLGRTLGDPSIASIALNTKLWSGTVAPFYYPHQVATTEECAQKIFKHNNCWLTSQNPCASFATGDVGCDIVYSTDVAEWPAYAHVGDCECGSEPQAVEWKRLGVPTPINAPTIVSSVAPSMHERDFQLERAYKAEPVAYVYTLVDSEGREGGPSPLSEGVVIENGTDVTMTIDPSFVGSGWDVANIRIYKFTSATDDLLVANDMARGYLFVKEIEYSAGPISFTDDVPEVELGQGFLTKNYQPPPSKLSGIISLPDGVLVGFESHRLWFSEPWDYHAWTCYLDLDDCIKSIEHAMGFIYVATDGHPYTISAASPAEDCRCCRDVYRHIESFPIGCSNSMVSIGNGVVYASRDGLVRLQNNSTTLITHKFMAEDDWHAWRPETIRGAYFKGKYVCFSDRIDSLGDHHGVKASGFVFDFGNSAYAEGDIGAGSNLYAHNLAGNTFFLDKQGFMFYASEHGIFQWESGNAPMDYVWRSRLNDEHGFTGYTAAKVVAEKHSQYQEFGKPVELTVFADGEVIANRQVTNGKSFRLPRCKKGIDYEVEIRGNVEIREIHLGGSIYDLTLVSNT